MSIAPITPSFGFGVTPGFGINPAYGVSATPPRTSLDMPTRTPGLTTFGQVLADRVAAFGPAATPVAVPHAIPGVTAVSQSSFGLPATAAVGRADTVPNAAAPRSYGSEMSGFVTDKLGELSAMNNRTDRLAVAAATGDLKDIHEYTIAANESGIATQLAVSVRDKALQAFNDIIRMQL